MLRAWKGRLLCTRFVPVPEMRRAIWRGGGVLAMAIGLMALADSRAHAQGILDFVSFDGIDYLRWAEEPGRPLERGDLGVEFATVGCSIGEDRRGCPFGVDAAAAFMPAGTRMYAVRGHATEFRLAAVWRDRIFLYQAWRNPRAKVGGKLYDIAGKVRAVDVRRGKRPSFDDAAPSQQAKKLYEYFVERLSALGLECETGVFQAMMQVESLNDGPVTILLDSEKTF